jgi:hypothetical protein
MATTAGGKLKRSYCFEPAQLAWLEAEAKRQDRTVNWLLRRIVQAAMSDAEQRADAGCAGRAVG